MEPRDAAADAAERAEAAGRRTREIADRLTRLAQGQRPDLSDVQLARKNADEALQRAQDSLERSVAGHERAALSHQRAAEAHEEAVRRGIGDAADHEQRARAHRQDALADLRDAASDKRRAVPAAPPSEEESTAPGEPTP